MSSPPMMPPEADISHMQDVGGADGTVNNASTAVFPRHHMDDYAAFVQRVLNVSAAGHTGDAGFTSA